jgi:hypothetical protein
MDYGIWNIEIGFKKEESRFKKKDWLVISVRKGC